MNAGETKAVFLSYASQDANAAKRICSALRVAGVEVWFDQNELRGGDAWDQKIRRQIKECALFLPIISANTQARHEGYFRLEWLLAVERSRLMVHDHPFLLPVIIDDTAEGASRVPEKFREVQWTKLPAGETSAAFCARVQRLLRPEDVAAESTIASSAPEPNATTKAKRLYRPIRRWITIATVAVTLATALSLWQPWRKLPSPALAAPGVSSGPAAEAEQLVGRVWEQLNRPELDRTGLDIADDLCRKASALAPEDARVWAAWSQVDSWYVYYLFDDSRRRSAQANAARAMQLAPHSFEARLADACYLVRASPQVATDGDPGVFAAAAERSLRALWHERPRDFRAPIALGMLLRNLRQYTEGAAVFQSAAALPGGAATAWNEQGWLYYFAHDLPASAAADERSLAVQPFWGNLMLRLRLAVIWSGDLDKAKAAIAQLPPSLMSLGKIARDIVGVYYFRREPESMLRLLDAVPQDWLVLTPKRYLVGIAQAMAGNAAAAQVAWHEALLQVQERLDTQPTSPDLLTWKALLLAKLGRRDEASEVAGVARSFGAILPPNLLIALGNIDAALEQLEQGQPGHNMTTYAVLRLDPDYDPLRGLPRFQALLARAEAEPKRNPNAKIDSETPMTSATPDPKSIAVLAFDNLSDDKANEYFSDGISEELISALGRVPGLTVKGSTSAFYFKHKEDQFSSADIARQLGVAYLVRGSVRKAGDQVRITAQLTRAATDEVVWSLEPETREVKDVFAVQEEVARLIAQKFELELNGTAATKAAINPEAYELYLQARQAWNLRNADGYDRAEKLLRQSIALAPDFAAAHAALADVWSTRGQDDRSISRWGLRESPAVARIAAKGRQAIGLDPNSAEAHASLGGLWWTVWRFGDAERELREAIRLNPNYASAHQWLGRTLMSEGKLDEGLTELKQATDLDPLSPRILDNYSLALLNAERPAEALEVADRALRLQPNAEQALAMKAVALAKLGRRDTAAAAARSLPPYYALHAEIALVAAGKLDEAAALLESIPQDDVEARIAGLIGLGRTSEALATLKPESLVSAPVDLLLFQPIFDPLRSDPRFREVLKTVGLAEANDRAQAWRAAHPPEVPTLSK